MSPWSEAEHNDGIVKHPGSLQNGNEFADLVVDVRDVGEIATPRIADMFRRDVEVRMVARQIEPLGMRVLLIIRNEPGHRFERLAVLVEVPILPPRHIGIVRVGE